MTTELDASHSQASAPIKNPTFRSRDRVRKRTPNACIRCRQQKIKCSGLQPCSHCEKRSLPCSFADRQRIILVTPETSTRHTNRDARTHGTSPERRSRALEDDNHHQPLSQAGTRPGQGTVEAAGPTAASTPTPGSNLGIDQQSESDHDESIAVSVHDDQPFLNPLVSGPSAFTAVPTGQSYYLGSSSNWSFGRRVLTLVHNRVFEAPLSNSNLYFDGLTYDLGWDGRRTTVDQSQPALPTADFALFLINAVKFHCGQLFHIFDEDSFMHQFGMFHDDSTGHTRCSDLWYIHYLFVLAIGKSLVGRMRRGKRPSGADLFVHGMQLLPATTFLCADPFQSTEVLCCAALYLQCLDMRIAAYNIIGQAMRTALSYGFHTDMPSHHHTPAVLERCREIWWTVYIMDCHMSALLGTPRTIAERDISARLPSFGGSSQRSHALDVHIKLANIEGLIQQTVYSKEGRTGNNFLKSIKTALKALADINDERTNSFPLQLETSISRLSAHLHLFHHQCIILNIKPLLYSFLQRRVETAMPVRIPSAGGVRSLLRVCVGSARQTTKILAALQAQTLLDVMVPFDLESTWSAALVLLITPIVDPSLAKDTQPSLQITYKVLDEMAAVGNTVAAFRRAELEQLENTLKRLEAMPQSDVVHDPTADPRDGIPTPDFAQPGSAHSDNDFVSMHSYDFEEALSGQQLGAIADSLNLNGLDWSWAANSMNELDASLL